MDVPARHGVDEGERGRMTPPAREKLMLFLAAFSKAEGRGYDRENAHVAAECLLLDLIDDADVRAAWQEARANWWYA